VKIADFGIATEATRNTTTDFMSTTAYASPEFLRNENPQFPSDIYSFGILL
jgi:serine/threonine protein kinase